MTEDDQALRAACAHILPGHKSATVTSLLETLARHPAAGHAPDFYGSGGAVAELEARTATLLGMERGLFFINGVTAQMTVLQRYAERTGSGNVALHPLSHIDLDEMNALERTAGLTPVRLGRVAPFSPGDLAAIDDPLAAVVVELPLRRAGYRLPPLDALREMSTHCRSRNIPLHFDGARLWEAAAGYGTPLAELAGLADSVYVSFYKGLGGLGGAVVAGSTDFIGSLTTWKSRFGGNMFTASPYALAGLAGLDRHLPHMSDYVRHARALAERLPAPLLVNPAAPDVNAFQLILPGTPKDLAARNRSFAREHGAWLFNTLVEAPIAGHTTAEIVIGDNFTDDMLDQFVDWIHGFANEPVPKP